METEKNKPVKVVRCGNVKASVWRNQRKRDDGTEYDFFSVNVCRVYADGEDKEGNKQWKETNSYDAKDLHNLIVVAQETFKHLKLKED